MNSLILRTNKHHDINQPTNEYLRISYVSLKICIKNIRLNLMMSKIQANMKMSFNVSFSSIFLFLVFSCNKQIPFRYAIKYVCMAYFCCFHKQFDSVSFSARVFVVFPLPKLLAINMFRKIDVVARLCYSNKIINKI